MSPMHSQIIAYRGKMLTQQPIRLQRLTRGISACIRLQVCERRSFCEFECRMRTSVCKCFERLFVEQNVDDLDAGCAEGMCSSPIPNKNCNHAAKIFVRHQRQALTRSRFGSTQSAGERHSCSRGCAAADNSCS